MYDQNQNHQPPQQQQPASASSKASGDSRGSASGFHVVGRYRTASGYMGAEIRVSAASGRFSYVGSWGAGSGLTADAMRTVLRLMLRDRRHFTAEIPFGGMYDQDGAP